MQQGNEAENGGFAGNFMDFEETKVSNGAESNPPEEMWSKLVYHLTKLQRSGRFRAGSAKLDWEGKMMEQYQDGDKFDLIVGLARMEDVS